MEDIDFLTDSEKYIIENLKNSIFDLDKLEYLENLANSLKKKEEENYKHVIQFAKREARLFDKINELETELYRKNENIINLRESIAVKNTKIRSLILNIQHREQIQKFDLYAIMILLIQSIILYFIAYIIYN